MLNTSSPRIYSLESLRGLAAVAVVFSHLVFAFWPSFKTGLEFPLSSLWHNGAFAVRLFFVLSGFVLPLSYFQSNDQRVLSAGASKRYFRLYMPAAASVFFSYTLHVSGCFHSLLVVQGFTDQSEWLMSLYEGQPSLLLAMKEAFLGPILDYQFMKYNEVLWTMGVELRCSFLVFATLALFGRSRRRWLVYAILLFALDRMQMRYAVDFVCGMALSDWHHHYPSRNPSSWIWIPLFVVGCCLGDLDVGWLEQVGVPNLIRGNRLWPTIAAMIMVGSCARSSRLESWLTMRPLVRLGEMSFAIYLFHLPIICSLGAWTYVATATFQLGHNVTSAVACLASILATLAIGRTGPLFLDPIAIRTGRWVERFLFAKDVNESPANLDNAAGFR